MNLYFLVEGKTERKIYPQWLTHLLPNYKRVDHFQEAHKYNYYLFSAGGYPSILDDIEAAVQNINDCGKYSHLVICIDADEDTVQERKEEVQSRLHKKSGKLNGKAIIIVQNRCIESWFLGNPLAYTEKPQNEILKQYCAFYNVSTHDPELMLKLPQFNKIAQFHKDYLKKMLKEKGSNYSVTHTRKVCEPSYIEELNKRVKDTAHLKSLETFFSFCQTLN
jgi:hypothetical protein